MVDSPKGQGFVAHVRYGLQRKSWYDMVFLLGLLVFLCSLLTGLVHQLSSESRLPSIVLNHLANGEKFFAQGDLNKALKEFRLAIAIAPDDDQAHRRLGIVAHSLGDVEEAVHEFKEALRRKPSDFVAHYMLGLIYLQQGRLEQAESHNQFAIQYRPGFADAYNNLATAQLRQGDVETAVRNYRQALALDPTLVPARRSLQALGREPQ